MSHNKLRLELELLLPEAPDASDACVGRLKELLAREEGVTGVHILAPPQSAAPMLCLHYDPGVLSLARLRNRATAAGVRLGERYGHLTLPLRVVAAEDAAGRIEESVRSIKGVLDAAVNLPAQQARVEFDRTVTTGGAITAAIAELGYAARPAANIAASADGDSPPTPGTWYNRNKELAWSLCAGLLLIAGAAGFFMNSENISTYFLF